MNAALHPFQPNNVGTPGENRTHNSPLGGRICKFYLVILGGKEYKKMVGITGFLMALINAECFVVV